MEWMRIIKMLYFKKFVLVFFISVSSFGADLNKLSILYQNNFNNFYEPRFCGENISRLLVEAQKQNIDLSNSYVLKVVGAGFLETSGFYMRNEPNNRKMLGYFHYVLVADNYVFDFDLHEPLVFLLEDYVRLQFTPPYEPFIIWGVKYDSMKELSHWSVIRYEVNEYLRTSSPRSTWTKSMPDVIKLKEVLSKKRLR